jgi:hypothetical protein
LFDTRTRGFRKTKLPPKGKREDTLHLVDIIFPVPCTHIWKGQCGDGKNFVCDVRAFEGKEESERAESQVLMKTTRETKGLGEEN